MDRNDGTGRKKMKQESIDLILEGLKQQLQHGQSCGLITLTTEPIMFEWDAWNYVEERKEE